MTTHDITWKIGDVLVDRVAMDQPERTRGETITLRCAIDGESATIPQSGALLSGEHGSFLSGPSGSLRSGGRSPQDRYEELRAYGEHAGEGASYQLIGGRPAVHENPQPEWPVDSHIVPVKPASDVFATPGFWALITGYRDTSVIREYGSALFRLELEMVFLADLHEFASRGDLKAALSPVTVQY